MRVTELDLAGVLLIEPAVHGDTRGFFLETWNEVRYAEHGIEGPFVQDNLSFSTRGSLRGLHFQEPHAQGKLVWVLAGGVFDVVVDVRCGSQAFGCWTGMDLSAENRRQLYVPPGYAHGFQVTADHALFAYKCTDYWYPECERGVRWDDPDLGIPWPIAEPILADKDRRYPALAELP
ncbi:dTDP-4-dehydrorhamnose 3,5-epimerase [soil metagenome]